jgi:hypothetical protein
MKHVAQMMLANMAQGTEGTPTQRHIRTCVFKFLHVPKSCLTDKSGIPRRISIRSKKPKKILRTPSWDDDEADTDSQPDGGGQGTMAGNGARLDQGLEWEAESTWSFGSAQDARCWISEDGSETVSMSAWSSFSSDADGALIGASFSESFRSEDLGSHDCVTQDPAWKSPEIIAESRDLAQIDAHSGASADRAAAAPAPPGDGKGTGNQHEQCAAMESSRGLDTPLAAVHEQQSDAACADGNHGHATSLDAWALTAPTSSERTMSRGKGLEDDLCELREVELALQSARGALNGSATAMNDSSRHASPSAHDAHDLDEADLLSGHMFW